MKKREKWSRRRIFRLLGWIALWAGDALAWYADHYRPGRLSSVGLALIVAGFAYNWREIMETFRETFRRFGELGKRETGIQGRISAVGASMAELKNKLMQQAEEVGRASRELEDSFSRQEHELEMLNTAVEAQRLELEGYRELATLSKEQQKAVLRSLAKESRGGLLWGFIIGVTASIVANALWIAVPKLAALVWHQAK